jgi:hypothetical protein
MVKDRNGGWPLLHNRSPLPEDIKGIADEAHSLMPAALENLSASYSTYTTHVTGFSHYVDILTSMAMGLAIAQAVGHQLPAPATWVRSQGTSCGICGT